jgi:hypothetical protein
MFSYKALPLSGHAINSITKPQNQCTDLLPALKGEVCRQFYQGISPTMANLIRMGEASPFMAGDGGE